MSRNSRIVVLIALAAVGVLFHTAAEPAPTTGIDAPNTAAADTPKTERRPTSVVGQSRAIVNATECRNGNGPIVLRDQIEELGFDPPYASEAGGAVVIHSFGPQPGSLFSVDPSGTTMDLSVGDDIHLRLVLAAYTELAAADPNPLGDRPRPPGELVVELYADDNLICSSTLGTTRFSRVYEARFDLEAIDVGSAELRAEVALNTWPTGDRDRTRNGEVFRSDALPLSVGEPYVFTIAGPQLIDHGTEATARLIAFLLTRSVGRTTRTFLDGREFYGVPIPPGTGNIDRHGGTFGLPLARSTVIASVSKAHEASCAYSPPHPPRVVLAFENNQYEAVISLDSSPGIGYAQRGDLLDFLVIERGLPPPQCDDGQHYSADDCGCIDNETDGYKGLLLGVSERIPFLDPEGVERNLRQGGDPPVVGDDLVDLQVNKIAVVTTAAPGDTVRYVIVARNIGDNVATEVTVTDPAIRYLPITQARAESDGALCFGGSGIRCEIPELHPGTEVTIFVELDFAANAQRGSYTNRASLRSRERDRNLLDNDDEATVQIDFRQADLRVAKVDSVDPVSSGGAFDYIVTVGNVGPTTARNVIVRDTLPTAVDFVSVSQTGGGLCSFASGTVTCDIIEIEAGATVEFVISVRVFAGFAGGLENQVTVDSDYPDPDRTNNTATESTTVEEGPPQLCALEIRPDNYDVLSPGCGIGNSQWSCSSPAEVNVTWPTTTLRCNAAGNCGSNNTILGEPGHVCRVFNLGDGRTRVQCEGETRGAPTACVEDFRIRRDS